jgi:hypothetical protein
VESPNAPLPTIKMEEGISEDAEEAMAHRVNTVGNTTTGQKKRKTWRKANLHECERRASAKGGPISLQTMTEGRASAVRG